MKDISSSDSEDSAQYQRIYKKLLEKEKKGKQSNPQRQRPITIHDRDREERPKQSTNQKKQIRDERSRSRQKKMKKKWFIYEMQQKFSFQYNRFPQQIHHLPIFKKKQEIIKNILENQIVLITGETGCGKSTQVPRLIYQYLIQQKSKAKILCVQPRRLAVLNLYHILDSQMKERQQIGYQIAMQSHISSKAKILFMTNGIFLQRLVHSSEIFEQFPFIILDEVHERDIDTDFILLAIKRIVRAYPKLRVILMSATIDNDLFSYYFANDHIDKFMEEENFYIRIMQKMDKRSHSYDQNENSVYEKYALDFMKSKQPCPTVNVTETGKFKRQIYYLDTLQQFLKRQYPKIWGGIIFSEKYPSTHRQLFKIVHYIIQQVIQRGTSDRSYSSVLIFLPGLLEIQTLSDEIKRQFNDNPYKKYLQIILVHSSILNEQITRKLHQLNKEKVKIILATNIAQSSITVMGVKYVIDFCLSKEVRFDQRSRMENLQLIWASQASCKQRAGRTGRVCDGVIIRLVQSNFFDKLPEYSTPQIQRSSLDRLVLRIKMIHQNENSQIFSDPGTVLGTAIQPPVLKNIDQAINSLLFCGGLKHVDDKLALTNLGRLYVDLPIDITYSKMLIMSILLGTFDDIIILVSILSQNKNPFKKHNIEKNYLKYFQMMDNAQRCDFRSLINAYKNTKRFRQIQSEYDLGKKHYQPHQQKRDLEYQKLLKSSNPVQFDVFKETTILIEDLGERITKKQILAGYVSAQGQSDYDQRFKFTLIGGLLSKMMVARQAIYDQKQQKRAKIMRNMGVNFKNTISLINSPNVRKSATDSITAQQKTKDFWKDVIAKNIGCDSKQIKLTITSGVSYLHFNNQRDLNKLLFIKYMEDNKRYSLDDRSQVVSERVGGGLNIQGMLKGLGDIDYMQNGTTFTLLKDQRVTIDHFSQNRQIQVSPGQKRRYLTTNTIMQQSSRLFCRYTSLIPEIPNIHVISHLIFHPFLSLIRDKKYERYQYISLKKRNKLKIQYQLTETELKDANRLRKMLGKFFQLQFLKKKQNDESIQQGHIFINENIRNNYVRQNMLIEDRQTPFLSQFWMHLKKFVFQPRLSLVDETKWQQAFFKQEKIELPDNSNKLKLQDQNDQDTPQFMNEIKSAQLRQSYFSSQYVSPNLYVERLTNYNNWKKKKLEQLLQTKEQAQNKNAYISCQHCSINIAPLKSVGSVSNSYYRQLYSIIQQNIRQLPFNEMGTHFCSLLMSLYIQKEFKVYGCSNEHYFAIRFEGQRNLKITKFSQLKIIFPDGSQQIADFDRLQYGRWREKSQKAVKNKEAMKIHKDCFVCDETFTSYKQIEEHFKQPYHIENIKDFKTSLPASEGTDTEEGY